MISSGGGAVEPLPHPRVAAVRVLEYDTPKEPRKTGQTKEKKEKKSLPGRTHALS